MKQITGGLYFVILLALVVACAGPIPAAIPTSTIPSTSTNIPTATETSTPFPTNTPLPSATPDCPPQTDSPVVLNSVQEKTAALVPGVKVTWYDTFHCEDLSYGWWGYEGYPNPTTQINVSNGIMKFSAQEVKDVWESFGRPNTLGDQKGFLVLFRYQANMTGGFLYTTGTWQTSDYREWGLSIEKEPIGNGWVGWHGSNNLNSYFPKKVLQPDKWYYLLEKLDNKGQVTMKLWEKDNPSNHADFQIVMPSNWIGHQWLFMVQVYEGTIEMDEYLEFSFDAP